MTKIPPAKSTEHVTDPEVAQANADRAQAVGDLAWCVAWTLRAAALREGGQ